jgi:S1-C subfamily serine protease
MKKIFSYSLLVVLFFVSVSSLNMVRADDESYKSVVQILAYGNIYGLHPVLRGRGSASIISSDGLLLTNNHVVSDDNGKAQTSFSICMSLTTSSRPVCNRTASLITKDEQKDIALLRIDPTDIRGNTVNYTSFRVASLDYTYVSNPQDATLAI